MSMPEVKSAVPCMADPMSGVARANAMSMPAKARYRHHDQPGQANDHQCQEYGHLSPLAPCCMAIPPLLLPRIAIRAYIYNIILLLQKFRKNIYARPPAVIALKQPISGIG
jgi:hypothetical protein